MCGECGRARGTGILLSGGNLPLMGDDDTEVMYVILPLPPLRLLINFLLPLVTAVKILLLI